MSAHRMLALRYADTTYVLHAADLAAIDLDGAGARVSVDGPVQDLSELLPGAEPAAEPVRLIVETATGRRAFRAAAELELFESTAVFHLPGLVRALGCAPWIRGVALLGSSSHEPGEPTLWIDLARLAAAT
jgi:hypothetical protein